MSLWVHPQIYKLNMLNALLLFVYIWFPGGLGGRGLKRCWRKKGRNTYDVILVSLRHFLFKKTEKYHLVFVLLTALNSYCSVNSNWSY